MSLPIHLHKVELAKCEFELSLPFVFVNSLRKKMGELSFAKRIVNKERSGFRNVKNIGLYDIVCRRLFDRRYWTYVRCHRQSTQESRTKALARATG